MWWNYLKEFLVERERRRCLCKLEEFVNSIEPRVDSELRFHQQRYRRRIFLGSPRVGTTAKLRQVADGGRQRHTLERGKLELELRVQVDGWHELARRQQRNLPRRVAVRRQIDGSAVFPDAQIDEAAAEMLIRLFIVRSVLCEM